MRGSDTLRGRYHPEDVGLSGIDRANGLPGIDRANGLLPG